MAAAGAGDFEVRCATGANGGQGMSNGMKQFLAATVLFFAAASAASADNRTTTGALTIDPPTLMALGFAWNIEGDDNRNARVTVNFRKKGTEKWQPALDLMRLQNEQIWTRGATGRQRVLTVSLEAAQPWPPLAVAIGVGERRPELGRGDGEVPRPIEAKR